jgi:hypothetical protein
MARTITIELNDLDEKCMRYLAADPEDWVNNFVSARIYAAKYEIYNSEIRRMTEDPLVTSIPASMDEVVLAADVKFADADPEIPEMIPSSN